MKHIVSVKAFNIGDELQELYWFAGTTFNDRSECIIRPIIKGVESGKFRMCHLPIGMLPFLTIGRYFDKGRIIDMTMRGTIDTIMIENMSNYVEITSAAIPPTLYSFDDKNAGKQRLLQYEIDGLEVFIPTIELIRYLFLHNKTLANVLMRPNGLMTLFNPQTPGFNKELRLDFTSDMPKTSLTNDFAQEFAWLAMDQEARKSWDSVMSLSLDQTYLTLIPPALKSSKLQFRGINDGKRIIVLEILNMTGKIQPCDKLIYAHPSMKQVVRLDTSGDYPINLNNDKDQDSTDSSDRYDYDFEVDDDGEGTTNQQSQKVLDIAMKRSGFERRITIERSLISEESNSKLSERQDHTTKVVKKILKVSAGDVSLNAELAPIEFDLLIPGSPEDAGDY